MSKTTTKPDATAKVKPLKVKHVVIKLPAALTPGRAGGPVPRTVRRVTNQMLGDEMLSGGWCWGFNTRSVRFDGAKFYMTDKVRVGKKADGTLKVKATASRDAAIGVVGLNLVKAAEVIHGHLSA